MSARLEAAVLAVVDAIRAEVAAESAPAPVSIDRLISIPEAAAALGIHRASVFRMLDRGELRSVRVGRRRLIPTSAINAIAGGAR